MRMREGLEKIQWMSTLTFLLLLSASFSFFIYISTKAVPRSYSHIFVIDNKEFRTVQQSNVQHDMSELFKCLCFMEMLSLSTRDHNASAVDPGCFMVYNCFQFHGFITN